MRRQNECPRQSGERGGCLRAARFRNYVTVDKVEKLADRDLAIMICVGLAFQPLQQEPREHAVTTAPPQILTGVLSDIARGGDGPTWAAVTGGGPPLIHQIWRRLSDRRAVTGIYQGHHIRPQCAFEYFLQVPHRDSGASQILVVRVVAEQVVVVGALAIVGAMSGKVNDGQIVRARFDQEIKPSAADSGIAGILVFEIEQILGRYSAPIWIEEKIADRFRILISKLQAVNAV